MKHHSLTYYLLLLCWTMPLWVSAQSNTRVTAEAVAVENGEVVSLQGDRRKYAFGSGGNNNKEHPEWNNGLYQSRYRGEHHFFGLWTDESYSAYVSSSPMLSSLPGGYAATAGFFYEYARNSLRVHIGLGGRWQDVYGTMQDTTFYRDTKDTQQYDYWLRYDFKDRRENSRVFYAQLPVMVGWSFGIPALQLEDAGFYLLAGAKVNVPVWAGTSVRAQVTTSGTYEQFLGHFVEQDNHGLRKEVPLTREHMSWDARQNVTAVKLFVPDVLLSAEVGFEWDRNFGWNSGFRAHNNRVISRSRIALFADFGVTNIASAQHKPWLYVSADRYQWDTPRYDMYHAMASTYASSAVVNNFFVGMRFTVMWGHKRPGKCVLCGYYRVGD